MSELIEKQVIIDWLKYKWNRSADSLFYGIQELPTTDIDLSGYSDKLWKLAYDRGYEKCRQDAIELAMQYCPDDDGTCSKADEDIRNLLDELEDLPSAQLELPIKEKCTVCPHCDNCDVNDDGTIAQSQLKTGKWLPCYVDTRLQTYVFKCSNCGVQTYTRVARYIDCMDYAYCPYCGVKMEGGGDNETN